MIKKIVPVISLCFACCFPADTFSQKVSAVIYNNFPPGIAIELYEQVVSKIDLSESSQLWLAKAYRQRDSTTALLVKNGKADGAILKRYIDSSNWEIEESFKKILSPTEIKDYQEKIVMKREYPNPVFKTRIVPGAEMASQFGAALKIRNALKLRDSQADSLLTYAALLKSKLDFERANPDSGYFDRPAFESEWMSKILTEDQYTITLAEKNKEQCQRQAKYVWYELEKTKLAAKYDKQETMKSLIVYYQIKSHLTERFGNEKERRSAMLNGLKIPDAMREWQQVVKADKTKLEKYAW